MITGWTPLYLRSRHVLQAGLAALGVIAAIWVVAADQGVIDERLAVMTTGVAMMLIAPTLGSFDQALDSTAAMPWPPRRVMHLTVFALLCAAALSGIGYAPGPESVRNCLGLAGLAGLGAGLVGARHAWILPLLWSAPQALLHSEGGTTLRQALLWLDQPGESITAAVTAASMFFAGASLYALRGGPDTNG